MLENPDKRILNLIEGLALLEVGYGEWGHSVDDPVKHQ
jgi:hypothetical protein